jgi:small subunit ribosomal protein S4e
MRKQHLSRLAAPRTWPIERKRSKWIAKPLPGAHNIQKSMPVVIVLRDILKIAANTKEVKKLLYGKKVIVNGKSVNEPRFAVGLFDTISVIPTKEHYRIIINKRGKLSLIKIPAEDAENMVLKVINKKILPQKKIQLNFSNGWNMLIKKDEYKTNDVVLFNINSKKLTNMPFSKGASVFVVGGKHAGIVANFIDINETGILRKNKIIKLSSKGTEFESSIDNVFVVGSKTPAIKVE